MKKDPKIFLEHILESIEEIEKNIKGNQLQSEHQIYPDYKTDEILLERVADNIRLPIHFRFGADYELLKMDYHKLVMMADIVYFNDIGETENVGIEYSFWENYKLRFGYKFNRDVLNIAFGGGVKFFIRNDAFFSVVSEQAPR